ncbi:hypothetical protein YC94_005021 [Salmonella enterica subsp. diarizonae]|nr:hypothetical protein [Salmonella enterica subsp. diarizonae]
MFIFLRVFLKKKDKWNRFHWSFRFVRGFVNGMVASHLLCHSGTINRH